MFCKNCGAQVPDEAKFCPKCGTRFDEKDLNKQEEGSSKSWWGESGENARENKTPGSAGPDIMNDEPPVRARTAEAAGEKKKSRLPMIIGIIVAAVVVIAVVLVLLFVVFDVGKPSINLNEYLEITVDGYDGHGTAEASLDTDRLEEDYKGKIKLTEEGEKDPDLSKYVDSDEDPIELIVDGVSVKLNLSAGLSNGDKITYTWNVDQSLTKNLNVNLKYSSDEETVEGLEDLSGTDVFENVKVDFSGVSPLGTAAVTVEENDRGIDDSMFVVDPSEGLSNDETVTVSISEEGLETLQTKYGLEPDETSKEFTVSGLPHYAANAGDIPEDTINDIASQTEEKLRSALNDEWSAADEGIDNGEGGVSRKLESANYLLYYFFSKESDGRSEGNEMFFVYEVHALQNRDENGKNELDEEIVYFWFADYSNIAINEDGSCSFPSDYKDSVTFFDGDKGSFDLDYTFEKDGNQTGQNYYVGFTDLYDLGSSVYDKLSDYTLTDDTTDFEEEEPAEENN